MKKYIICAVLLLCITGINSCSKKHLTKFPTPDWQTDKTGKYPVSMTAVVQLPGDLKYRIQSGDRMGAFIDNECRGIGEIVQVDSTQVFFVMIHGTATEHAKIAFKYYSARSSYLYLSKHFLSFAVDENYGTVDEPKILDLKPIR